MVNISIRYDGDLHCSARHGPSDSKLATDAPTDNRGKGEAFSPTDLVATALGTCMSTTMGIKAEELGVDLAFGPDDRETGDRGGFLDRVEAVAGPAHHEQGHVGPLPYLFDGDDGVDPPAERDEALNALTGAKPSSGGVDPLSLVVLDGAQGTYRLPTLADRSLR